MYLQSSVPCMHEAKASPSSCYWAGAAPAPGPGPATASSPYYQNQKDEMEMEQLEETLRMCRNSRNMDPDCNQYYDMLTSGETKVKVVPMMALSALVVLAAWRHGN
ncbi:unnamed protein product [Sphagnum tenellum]